MIPIETHYKNQNCKYFTIDNVIGTWWHYLKDSKYILLIFTDHNNFS